MLPSLAKTYNGQESGSNNQSSLKTSQQPKIYDPPFQGVNREHEQSKSKIYSSKKIRTAKDFKRSNPSENKNTKSGQEYNKAGYSLEKNKHYQSNINNVSSMPQSNGPIYIKKGIYYQNSNKNLAQEIKLIQKKIRQCQKKIDLQKKKAQIKLMAQTGDNSGSYDFQRVIKRQMQIQQAQRGRKRLQIQEKGFDYLTNPGKAQQYEQQAVQEQAETKPYSINQGIQKLERHYQNNLKKKFERREMFPHQACKRKTPKLSITEKNAMKKQGKASTDQEHMFRVMTKQITPQQIYPTIPNFAVVKDSLSKNIVAYLGDYKPFVEKTRQNRDGKSNKQEMAIQNNKKDMIKQEELGSQRQISYKLDEEENQLKNSARKEIIEGGKKQKNNKAEPISI